MDLAFFAANLLKIAQGGWAPLLLGALIFSAMLIWHAGNQALKLRHGTDEMSRTAFLAKLASGAVARVPGTAVFLTGSPNPVSQFMQGHVAQFGALQEKVISLRVVFEEYPRVPADEHVEVSEIAPGFWHVIVHVGFVEVPNLVAALAAARLKGCKLDLHDALYFVSRDEAVSGHVDRELSRWQRLLFSFMNRNAVHPVDRFDLPATHYLGVSRRIEI